MSEERMLELVQGALKARGIDDQVVAAGQFYPRGHSIRSWGTTCAIMRATAKLARPTRQQGET
jgi:hypothetical protein